MPDVRLVKRKNNTSEFKANGIPGGEISLALAAESGGHRDMSSMTNVPARTHGVHAKIFGERHRELVNCTKALVTILGK